MMEIMRRLRVARTLLTVVSVFAGAVTPVIATAQAPPPDTGNEQADLNQAVNEAMGSSIDLSRSLEEYLVKYPDSPRRAEIETSLYKTANDSNDSARIVLYGE